MSITIEQLDNEGKENNITILIGKNLVLKFLPGDSIYFHEKKLQDFIRTSDLFTSALLSGAMDEKRLSGEISNNLSEMIKLQEEILKITGGKLQVNDFVEYLKARKQVIISKGDEIKKLEGQGKISLATNFPLFFCQNCNSYLGNSIDSLTDSCKLCGTEIDPSTSSTIVKFLDGKIIGYLDGFWLEDYIARILTQLGWKTWCHGSVMGSSGIYHPIDILAINSEGQILVAECKSGGFGGKDVFNFTAQYFDIKGFYGFFFALRQIPDPKGKNYMQRTPGLCLLDNLAGHNDLKLIETIRCHLKVS